jgi:hypothetical protein
MEIWRSDEAALKGWKTEKGRRLRKPTLHPYSLTSTIRKRILSEDQQPKISEALNGSPKEKFDF